MYMKNIIFLLFLFTSVHLFADSFKNDDKEKYPFNYGRMDDTIYTNPFFGFKIAIPSDWFVQNKTQIDYVLSKGKDVVTFDSEILNKAVKSVDVNSLTLLLVYKYETGAPVKYNPSIVLMAENVLMQPGIKTGGDYLFHVRKGLMQSNLNFDCSESDSISVLDEYKFYKIDCDVNEGVIQQNYFTAIIKRFAFSFIISFSNETEKNELLSIINSTEFK